MLTSTLSCRSIGCHQEVLRRVQRGIREGEQHQDHAAGGGRRQTGNQRPTGSSSAYQHQRSEQTQLQHGLTAKPHSHCQTGTCLTNVKMSCCTPFWSVCFQHGVFSGSSASRDGIKWHQIWQAHEGVFEEHEYSCLTAKRFLVQNPAESFLCLHFVFVHITVLIS